MSQPSPCPLVFLADEIAETSRLTRELTAAAGHAIATLAEQAGDALQDHVKQVVDRHYVGRDAQGAGLQARQVEQVSHEPRQPVRLGLDRRG